MKALGSELVGRTYVAPNGCSFTVAAVESYPREKVNERYCEILNLPTAKFVAVSYRGTLIPNITLKGGVARLIEVEVTGGGVYKRPGAISAALGIRYPFAGYHIQRS